MTRDIGDLQDTRHGPARLNDNQGPKALGDTPGRPATALTVDISIPWTDMPAAETDFRTFANHRWNAPLAGANEVALGVYLVITGAVGAELEVQISVDGGSSWENTGAKLVINPPLGLRFTGFKPIPEHLRRDDAIIRIAGRGGDGVADPSFQQMTVYIR